MEVPRNSRPANAEKIGSYEELRRFAKRFGEGGYNCLIFVGPPGRLKSTVIEEETKGEAHLISGNASPFEVFCEAQENANKLLVIDDADSLYRDSSGQRLLKQLTNPKSEKLVSWTTNAPASRDLAKSFVTTSKVCIIDNAWNGKNEHILALEDRARLFLFEPSPSEVHDEMSCQDWFNDDEVYQFIGDNLSFYPELSVRSYVKASEAKEAGEDWRRYLLKGCVDPLDLELLLIEYDADWGGRPVDEKCKEWCQRTTKSRATYFNRKRSLMQRMPRLPVNGRWALGA